MSWHSIPVGCGSAHHLIASVLELGRSSVGTLINTENRRVVALAALTNGLVRGGLDQTHYFDLACRISDRQSEKTFCRFPMIGLAATFAGPNVVSQHKGDQLC
jgi:hypothetical protein